VKAAVDGGVCGGKEWSDGVRGRIATIIALVAPLPRQRPRFLTRSTQREFTNLMV